MPFLPDIVDLTAASLRDAQRGALHAAVVHRSSSDEPAQIILPTGVGKTLVANLLPYVLGATRALVVAPARIIRDQVAHQFKTLEVARDLGALAEDVPLPATLRADRRCDSDAWETAREHDAVIGTPQVLSHATTALLPSRKTCSTW